MIKAIFICLLLPMIVAAQKTPYTFKVNISNFKSHAKVIFLRDGGKADSSEMSSNGKFVVKGFLENKEPIMVNILINIEKDTLADGYDFTFMSYYICPGLTTFNCEASEPGDFGKVDLLNQKFTDEFSIYKDKAEIDYIVSKIRDKTTALADKYFKGSNIQKAKFKETYDTQLAAYVKELQDAKDNWIKQHPDHFYSFFILNEWYNPADSVRVRNVAEKVKWLSPEMQKTELVKSFQKRIDHYKSLQIGGIAPNLTANDANGKTVSLADYRGKYLYLLVNSSKKPLDNKDIKDLIVAYNKYKPKNFEVLEFSPEENKEDWEKFVKEQGSPWLHIAEFNPRDWFFDSKQLQLMVDSPFGRATVPGFYLLDPSGKILGKYLKGERLNKKLQEIFGE